MAFTNTPANVQGPVVTAIALAAPAAAFTGGVEIGMKKPSKIEITPITVDMSSKNPLTDAYKILVEADSLQNRIADLKIAHTYAGTYVQAVMKTASGHYIECVGQTSDDETLLGLGYDFQFKQNDSFLKYQLMGEMGAATWKAAQVTTTTNTWTAGVAAANRRRPGVKSILIGGAHLGALKSVDGSLKSVSTMVQLNRPLLLGTEVSTSIVLAQNSVTDCDAAIDAANGSDSVVINFWNGDTIKYTNLLAGKPATISYGSEENTIKIDIKAFFPKGATRIDMTTDVAVAEFIFLDNEAQA